MTRPRLESVSERRNLNRLYFWIYGVVVAALIAVAVAMMFVDPVTRGLFMRENGVIETLSAVGYGAAFLLLAVFRRGIKSYPHLLIMLAALGLRELDFHDRFTTLSISGTRFYVSPEVPVIEKMIAVAVIGLLLYCLLRIVKNHGRSFVRGVKAGRAANVGVLLALGMTLIVKILDGLSRKLADIGILFEGRSELFSRHIEESLELGIPVLLALAVIAGINRSREPGNHH